MQELLKEIEKTLRRIIREEIASALQYNIEKPAEFEDVPPENVIPKAYNHERSGGLLPNFASSFMENTKET
jgi:hypothetical protein